MMKRALLLSCTLAFFASLIYGQRLNDSSDWWSINREDSRTPNVKPSRSELQSTNFAIADITLGYGGSDAITTRLGRAPEIERGDASTGRSQLCYASVRNSAVHLVFEFGEDESVFYLFSGGPSWKGSKFCVPSQRILETLRTPSGLKLGLSPHEVEEILGRPDSATVDQFVYSRQFDKKSSPQEFERQRKEYPIQLSDAEAHKQFDYYPVEQYILVRFADSKLVYLAVSISGSGD